LFRFFVRRGEKRKGFTAKGSLLRWKKKGGGSEKKNLFTGEKRRRLPVKKSVCAPPREEKKMEKRRRIHPGKGKGKRGFATATEGKDAFSLG